MIITELYSGQGLGNQLWCYSVCRSIADELNMPFKISGKENFKGKGFLNIDFFSKEYEELYSGYCATGKTHDIFYERLFYDPELDYIASGFDGSVRMISPNTKIEGFFQSEKYFFNDLERIKRYIKIKDDKLSLISIPNNACVLNIRGGEYKRHKRFILPRDYWLNAMKNMKDIYNVNNFVIVTDDPKYVKALLPDIKTIITGIAESWIALYRASFLIVSNSTFSYFPIKVKIDKPVVIAPKYFARFNDKLNRWASPANIYKDWLWQDRCGELATYEKCMDEAMKTEEYYLKNYHILTPPNVVYRNGFRNYIPRWIKRIIKRIFSILFPLKFG